MTPVHQSVVLTFALAALLTLAVIRDVSRNRIDNAITFPGAIVAIGLHFVLAGWLGAGYALSGLLVGLLVLLPFHLAGGMAAGDVKLMAAAGAYLGPGDAFWAGCWSLIAGAVMGLAVLGVKGGLRDGVLASGRQFVTYALTRVWVPPPSGSVATQRFAYAAAIAGGAIALVAWRYTRFAVAGA